MEQKSLKNNENVQESLAKQGVSNRLDQSYAKSNTSLQMIDGYNDNNERSTFDCEWIDQDDSPYRKSKHSFPSDIQIGFEGINVGVKHEIRTIQVQFTSQISIENNKDSENKSWAKKQKCIDKSIDQHPNDISINSNFNPQESNLLGQELQLLNNSKQNSSLSFCRVQKSFEQQCENDNGNNNENDFFTQEKQIISQIRPSVAGEIQGKIYEIKHQKPEEQNQSKQNQTEPTGTEDEKNQETSLKSDQITVTVNELSLTSRILENLDQMQENSKFYISMGNFLQSNQSSYRPFYRLLEKVIYKAGEFCQKSNQNIRMYCTFFKEKAKQYEAYTKEIQNPQTQTHYQSLKSNKSAEILYQEPTALLRAFRSDNIRKVKKYRQFYKQAYEIHKELLAQVEQAVSARIACQQKLHHSLTKIKQIDQDLQTLIRYKVQPNTQKEAQLQHKVERIFLKCNVYIRKDTYLQTKLLIQRQQEYLRQIKQLRMVLIKFITNMCLIDEFFFAAKVKQHMINYTDMLLEVQKSQYESNKESLESIMKKRHTLEEQKINQQLKRQIGNKIINFFPSSLQQQLNFPPDRDNLTPEQILERFNTFFQNQMFLNHIQTDQSFIFFQTTGEWLSKEDFKIKEKEQSNLPTLTENQQSKLPNQTENGKSFVKIILTLNKYLHLEKGEKIATLKLSDIKISKKGRYLIFTDRGKGIVGFIVNNGNQLGRIRLQTTEAVQEFALKIKQLIENQ